MIRACLVVAALLFSDLRTPFPAGWSGRPSPNMARRLWRPGHGPRAFPTRKSRKPGDASNSSGVRFPPAETMVQAVPDQVAVLDFARSPMGRHDFHIVAIRHIR